MSSVEKLDAIEVDEWTESLDSVLRFNGPAATGQLLRHLSEHAQSSRVPLPSAITTPFRNTISPEDERPMPGDLFMERRIRSLVRWNAMAMVMRANDNEDGLGGHISSFSSSATLYDVGMNHFFRGTANGHPGDLIYYQGHSAPGMYARSYLEGVISEEQLENFRREVGGNGLSSYPHPWLMPDYWQFPTVSMGLGPIQAIYQAHVMKYQSKRGLVDHRDRKIWCFLGDGECDEPESLGAIALAGRERLGNLHFVINCNLQRLDGPVRGNGKIIQELERTFRGADWNVLKVIWGSGWDALLARDDDGVLQKRMDECLDGDYQMYSVLPGDVQREHWVEGNPRLEQMMNTLTDDEVRAIKRGGQDQKKIYAAFAKASAARGKPTVILVKTVKGDSMGAQGKNTAHQYKNMSADERIKIAAELRIPLTAEQAANAEFYRPDADAPEMAYLHARRAANGGWVPNRQVDCTNLEVPELAAFAEFLGGSGEREVSSTMVMVRLLSSMLRMPELGRYVVPIVPDEARTFGMDGLFKIAGIYSHDGQKYRPVDADSLLPYREASDGQILQEGICEVGAMASFMAAGSAYAVHGLPMIPFYIFYSMFGMQRVGDMVWGCGDMMCKGFLLGGTAGRTTLNGEGLQHQDGHSHVLASTVPSMLSYDPAFGYELAIIVREGMRRMYVEQEDIFYYLTLYNENYLMPDMARVIEQGGTKQDMLVQGVLDGGYCFDAASSKADIHLLASGSMLQQAILAKAELQLLGYSVDIWSITSFVELQRDALAVAAANRQNPEAPARTSKLSQMFDDATGAVIAVTDYMTSLAQGIAAWMPEGYEVLGTDGFGLSESRPALRAHFEVDAAAIVKAALANLYRQGLIDQEKLHASRR